MTPTPTYEGSSDLGARAGQAQLAPTVPAQRFLYTNVPSDRFVLSAGSVLFRTHPSTGHLQLCAVHNTHTQQWILPKGRKDQGESMAAAAVRETYEETGYPCVHFPTTMPTRAPAPGTNLGPFVVLEAENSVEPFYVTVRELREGSLKLVWWYITWVENNDGEKVTGVHMEAEEGYVSEFVDVARGLEIFRGTVFHEVVEKAVELVTATVEKTSMAEKQ